MGVRTRKGGAGAIVALALAMALAGSAQAGAAERISGDTLGATASPSGSSTGGTVEVGTGWTDVSALKIVGTIDHATGKVTMLA